MMSSVLRGAALGTVTSVLVLGAAAIMAPPPQNPGLDLGAQTARPPQSGTPPKAASSATLKNGSGSDAARDDVAVAATQGVAVPARSDFNRGPTDAPPRLPSPAGAPLSAPGTAPRPLAQQTENAPSLAIAGTDPGARPDAAPTAPEPQAQDSAQTEQIGQTPAPDQPIALPASDDGRAPRLAPGAEAPDAATGIAPERHASEIVAPKEAPAPAALPTLSKPDLPEPGKPDYSRPATPPPGDIATQPSFQSTPAESAPGDAMPAQNSADAGADAGEPALPQVALPDPSALAPPPVTPGAQSDAAPDASSEAPSESADAEPEIVPAPGDVPDNTGVKPRVITLGTQDNAGQPSSGLRTDPNVVVDRLPQIGEPSPGQATPDDSSVEPGAAPGPEMNPAPAADAAQDEPPIRRFAQPFARDPSKPLFSVVLIDPGAAAGGLDPQTIAAIDMPVTVAIDPERPDAAKDAAALHAAGREVAILASGLPPDATPEDVEVALEAWRQEIPEAVAVVEPPDPVFQNNRQLARQMVSTLDRDGLGLVTQDRGFDSANQIAASADMPRAQIWRVLDDQREKAPLIERMLSRAGFEAARNGQIVVMLSAWPDSIEALGQWGPDAAGTYDLAPISAVALQNAGAAGVSGP
ncbi:hypothetical protein DL1_05095 [Thioclava dalianensis]|uniref:Divergent polysaccharide deacetylase n=1 Tax=Thioclava dalianensis TaxID=1185766 RepID=A0A074TC74_9RHOB|nr:divergent polysaccharide deacetylase family protein [Thioclava dalianensis]KEP69284.1 hypothetical protein DL1_05095 [Thioclava dalianensis]SFM73438.1 Uncharacterized conserved protein YibQ, putative polysaccharide deacetylase 2 family [Thioclava dalianensis]